MKLHGYFRSGAAYRVRIALALKGLDWTYMPVHLLKKEQLSPEFAAIRNRVWHAVYHQPAAPAGFHGPARRHWYLSDGGHIGFFSWPEGSFGWRTMDRCGREAAVALEKSEPWKKPS